MTRTKRPSAFSPVQHDPAQCPNCASAHSRITGTRHPADAVVERSHCCLSCGTRYVSLQTLPPVDLRETTQNPANPDSTA